MSDAPRGSMDAAEYKLAPKDVRGHVYEYLLSHIASAEGSGSYMGCPRPALAGVCRTSNNLEPTTLVLSFPAPLGISPYKP